MKKILIKNLFLLLAILMLIFLKDEGRIFTAKGVIGFKSPHITKFAALMERKIYFEVWIDKIIAPNVSDDEERIAKIAKWVSAFPRPENLKVANKDERETEKKFSNIEQHEYHVLIKQYGTVSEKVRAFCLLTTIAGYQAIPFRGEADGRVVVRIPSSDKWLNYNIGNKKLSGGIRKIQLSDEVKNEIKSIAGFRKIWQRKYTRGDKNVPFYRFTKEINYLFSKFKILPPPDYVDAVDNDNLIMPHKGTN